MTFESLSKNVLYFLGFQHSSVCSDMSNLGCTHKEVFRAKILSKILYGSPAWWGYCSVNTCNRIDSFLKKSKKFGLYDSDADFFETLCQTADKKLFDKIRRDRGHVLHRFLPESRAICYNLRPRRHVYILPIKDNRNFFHRVLFKDIV